MWKDHVRACADCARSLGATNEATLLEHSRTPINAREIAMCINARGTAVSQAAAHATIDRGDPSGSLYTLKFLADLVVEASGELIEALDVAISEKAA